MKYLMLLISIFALAACGEADAHSSSESVCSEWTRQVDDGPEEPYLTQTQNNGMWTVKFSSTSGPVDVPISSDKPVALNTGWSSSFSADVHARYIEVYSSSTLSYHIYRCVD